MAHECPECSQQCHCDGDDTGGMPNLDCQHSCDFFDEDGFRDCPVCEGAGCASCIQDYQCCAASPDYLHSNPERGDREAISAALVAPLFCADCGSLPHADDCSYGDFAVIVRDADGRTTFTPECIQAFCDHPSNHVDADGFIVCSDCGEEIGAC